MSTHNLCFEQKYQIFLSGIFQFLEVQFSIYLNRRIFVISADFALRVREVNQYPSTCKKSSDIELVCFFIWPALKGTFSVWYIFLIFFFFTREIIL